MKIYKDESLNNFEFWSGGYDTAKYLTYDELNQIETMLEEIAPEEGWDETAINDFFWFEADTIAEWLGYSNFEELMNRDNEA